MAHRASRGDIMSGLTIADRLIHRAQLMGEYREAARIQAMRGRWAFAGFNYKLALEQADCIEELKKAMVSR